MSDSLVPVEAQALVSKYATEDNFAAVVKAASFHPRIQLMSSSAGKVKEGAFPMGNFALISGQSYTDLGKEFNAVVLAWRPKAMTFAEPISSYYDPKNPEFIKIKERADIGGEENMGFGYGVEFLFWLPDFNTYATYFMANATARRESPNVHSNLNKVITLKSEVIKTKRFTWHGPKTYSCGLKPEMPESQGLIETINKFNNPPESETETVEEPSRSR